MVIIEAESPESDSIIVPESQSVPVGSRAFTPKTKKNVRWIGQKPRT
jgi:hypothetical protein